MTKKAKKNPANKAAMPARKKKRAEPARTSAPPVSVRTSEPRASEPPVSARTPSMRPSAPPLLLKEDAVAVEASPEPGGNQDRLPSAPPLAAIANHGEAHEEREENDFFERPSREDMAALAAADEEDDHAPPLPPKMSDFAIARRAQYRKYVNAVMAICGGVLALGVVSTAVRRGGGDESTAAAGVPQPAPPPKQAKLEPPTPPAVALPAPLPPAQSAEPVKPAEAENPAEPVKAAEPAKPVEPEKPVEVQPAPAPEKSGKTSLEEKRDAQRSLERGKWQDSIAAAERSVALDPTDGEAWLLLGAAYQSAGKPADARRAFNSCLKEGKKGPISECRAMLR